jgi:hypothetical protein
MQHSFYIHPIKTTCDDRSDSGNVTLDHSLAQRCSLSGSELLVVGVHNGSDSDGCDSKGSNGAIDDDIGYRCLIGKYSEPGHGVMTAEAEMAARRMQWQMHGKHGRRR